MSGSSKSKTGFWFGYMEAGDKSSAVLRDERLDTGNRKTVFLFNLARRDIVEYTREIVEPKLRELKPGEAGLIDELTAAYNEAKRAAKSRGVRVLNIPERASAARKQTASKSDDDGYEDFMDNDDEDSAWVDDAEEEET